MAKLAPINCGGKLLPLDTPQIMGVLNLTPDSFSDGGRFIDASGRVDIEHALTVSEAMVEDGASIIDIGGESTRPGAAEVSDQAQIDRVAIVIERLASRVDVIISVDTSSPELMTESARLGAGMINDIRSLVKPDALAAAATSGLAVCMMHMQGQPESMQDQPTYVDIVQDVLGFFERRILNFIDAGIDKSKIMVDPGFGFGKKLEHNVALLRGLERFTSLGLPLLVGISRKAMIGQLTGRPVQDRVHGSVAAALLAIQGGANIVRVHDVAATKDMIKMHLAIAGEAG